MSICLKRDAGREKRGVVERQIKEKKAKREKHIDSPPPPLISGIDEAIFLLQ